MDLKYVTIEQICFLNSWRKMIEKVNEIDLNVNEIDLNVNEREGLTSGN